MDDLAAVEIYRTRPSVAPAWKSMHLIPDWGPNEAQQHCALGTLSGVTGHVLGGSLIPVDICGVGMYGFM